MIVSITEISFTVISVWSNRHFVSCVKAHSTVGIYGPKGITSNEYRIVEGFLLEMTLKII